MAVLKRGKFYYLRIRPFNETLINVRTMAQTKVEALRIERAVRTACGSQDYRSLDPESRETCVRMFRNQGWQMPADLSDQEPQEPPKEELTLWKAVQLCLTYPDVRNSTNKPRHENSFARIVERWGKKMPIKDIWIPQIKEYQMQRLNEGAAPSTINKEKSSLSKMFQVLVELRRIDINPARLVGNLSEKASQRHAYISWQDFQRIVEQLPAWFRSIAQTSYYTGMRRGEVVGLTRRKVRLADRMIFLGPDDVKERNWKRVPIHRELIPILEEVMKVRNLGTDALFLHNGEPVAHRDEFRWCWDRRISKMGFDPPPVFHDLRHTWKTNARRSGMDSEIREAILGHWFKAKSINERYGVVGDQEMIKAIDQMTFDHGPTVIIVRENHVKTITSVPGCDQGVIKSKKRKTGKL